MSKKSLLSLLASLSIGFSLLVSFNCTKYDEGKEQPKASRDNLAENDRMITNHAEQMIEEGRQIFRFETFGSEAFWGDALQLHKAIAGEKKWWGRSWCEPKDCTVCRT